MRKPLKIINFLIILPKFEKSYSHGIFLILILSVVCYGQVEKADTVVSVYDTVNDTVVSSFQGSSAPLFSLFPLEKIRYFHLSDNIGIKIIVLDFFATWCTPCIKAIPKLHKIADSLDAEKYTFYLIDVSYVIPPGRDEKHKETKKALRKFRDKMDITIPILVDKYAKVYEMYGKPPLPLTIVIDLDGKISYYHSGYEEGDEKLLLEHLLGKK